MRALILTIIVLLPTYVVRFQIGPLPTTLLETLLLILFIAWGIQKGRALPEHIQSIPKTLQLPIGLFILAGTISVFVSPDLRAALGLWRAYIIEPILFFVIFLDVARGWKNMFHDIIMALGISALVVSTIAIYQHFIPTGISIFGATFFAIPNAFWSAEATRRVTSVYGYPNAIGLFLAPITTMIIGYMAVVERGMTVNRILLFFTSLAAIVAMFFAQSEGALIATGAGLLFFGLTFAPARRWTIGIVTILLVLTLSIPAWRSYASDVLTFNFDSGSIRLLQWKDTARMLADNPIFGAGLAGYPTAFAPYHSAASYIEIYQYPHNILLNFWSEMGLLGVISFAWVVTWFYRLSSRPRHGGVAMTAAMTAILVHGLVDVPYLKNDLAIFFWLLIGLIVLETTLAKNTENV